MTQYTLDSIRSKYSDFKYNGQRESRDGLASSLTGALTTQNGFIGQLVKVPAKYYLEFRKGEEIVSVMSFPYDPDAVAYNRPTPVNVTYTLGGVVREANTIRRHDITLTGRSGRAFRTAYTRTGALFYTEGEEVFQEFDEFLKRYSEICSKEFGLPSSMMSSDLINTDINLRQSMGTGVDSIHMVLRCLDENLHLKVEPINFRWEKTSDNTRFDYRWVCSFVAYDYSTPYTNVFFKALDFVDNQVSSIGGVVGGLNNVISNVSNDYIGRVRESIQKVGGTFGVLSDTINASSGLLSNAVGVASDFVSLEEDLNYAVKDFQTIKNIFAPATRTIAGGVDSISDNIGNAPVVIAQGAAALTSAKGAASIYSEPIRGVSDKDDDEYISVQNGITLLKKRMSELRGQIPAEFYNNRQKNISSRNSESLLGTFLGDETNYSLLTKGFKESNISDQISNKNFYIHYIEKDEDLVGLATRFLGNPSEWVKLMRINNWRDARRDASGNFPNVGDIVYIPLPPASITNPFGDKNDFIGVDIKMDFDDISFKDGDIELVRDNDNMKQFVKNTLMTRNGQVPGFPSFGLPELPQVSDLIYGGVIVRESLIKDSRILDVKNINLTLEEDSLIVNCDVLIKNNDKIKIKTLV